jgi:hypothetical protein
LAGLASKKISKNTAAYQARAYWLISSFKNNQF